MSRPAILLLLAALAACGKAPSPEPPTAQAVAAELATFPQLLVPISSSAWIAMQTLESAGAERPTPDHYPQPYAHASAAVGGRQTSVFVGYTSVFLAPAPMPLQPMSVQQYLRAFAADAGTDLASVVAPKGTIFFTREQLPDVIGSARTAGASSTDLPFGTVRGAAK